MLTKIDIPDDLYRQVESKAAREGVPVDNLIAQTLRLMLGDATHAGRQRTVFPLHHSARPGTLSVEEARAAEEAAAQQEDASRAGTL